MSLTQRSSFRACENVESNPCLVAGPPFRERLLREALLRDVESFCSRTGLKQHSPLIYGDLLRTLQARAFSIVIATWVGKLSKKRRPSFRKRFPPRLSRTPTRPL